MYIGIKSFLLSLIISTTIIYKSYGNTVGTLNLCGMKNEKRDAFISVDRNGYDVNCVGKYSLVCMKKNQVGTGLRLYNQNGWKLETYGNDKIIDAYIQSIDTCTDAKTEYEKVRSDMICEIRFPGQELKFDGTGISMWRDICNDNDNNLIGDGCKTLDLCKTDKNSINVDSCGINIKCPGKYNLICIKKGHHGTGLHFFDQNGWQLKPYGNFNNTIEAYVSKTDTCDEVRKEYESIGNEWHCDVSFSEEELKVEEGKPVIWNKKCEKVDGTIDLCNRRDRYIKVNKGGWDIKCPGQYTRVCIKNNQSGKSLKLFNDENGWKLTANDDYVEGYIQSVDSCTKATRDYQDFPSGWWCDISKPGQDLTVEENKPLRWNKRCNCVCEDKTIDLFEDSDNNILDVDKCGWNIKSSGKYTLLCIAKNQKSMGLYLTRQNTNKYVNGDKTVLNKLNIYGSGESASAYIKGFDSCTEAKRYYDEILSTNAWWCDIGRTEKDMDVKEGESIKWDGKCDSKLETVNEIIDLSKSNKVIDYNSVIQAVDGVILCAGYREYDKTGNIVKDEKLDTHYNGLQGNIRIGYYFISQATNFEEAIEEANAVHNYIKDKDQPSLPVYLVSEYSITEQHNGRADNLNKHIRTECVVAFINRIEELGYKPGVYASESWFKNNLDYERIIDTEASIWISNYSSEPKISIYDIWQYSNGEYIEGIVGNVNKSRVSVNSFQFSEIMKDSIWKKEEALLTNENQITSNNVEKDYPVKNLLLPEDEGYGTNQYIWHTSWNEPGPNPAGTDTYLQVHFNKPQTDIIFTMISSEWLLTSETPDEIEIMATNTPNYTESWVKVDHLKNMIIKEDNHPTFYTSPHISLGKSYTDLRFVIKRTTNAYSNDPNGNPFVSLGRFQVYRAVEEL